LAEIKNKKTYLEEGKSSPATNPTWYISDRDSGIVTLDVGSDDMAVMKVEEVIIVVMWSW
jgi:hypothetical protein